MCIGNRKGITKLKKYEKPIVLANEELSEGVYASSGSTGGSKCDSIYMIGIYRALVTHGDADSNHTMSERGCEGCPANWNNGRCNIDSCNYEDKFMPSWEEKGFQPTSLWEWV